MYTWFPTKTSICRGFSIAFILGVPGSRMRIPRNIGWFLTASKCDRRSSTLSPLVVIMFIPGSNLQMDCSLWLLTTDPSRGIIRSKKNHQTKNSPQISRPHWNHPLPCDLSHIPTAITTLCNGVLRLPQRSDQKCWGFLNHENLEIL